MATQTEVLVLEINTAQYKKEIADATARLVLMKNQLAILDDALKKGNISIDDYAQKASVLKGEIQATSQQQNTQIKVLNNYTNQNKLAAGSVDQLKARLAVLTAQYNALSEEERENTEYGKALTAETLRVNEALKKQGAEVGDTRRFVGGYSEAIQKAISGNSQFAEGLQMVKEGFATVKESVSNIAADIKTQWNGAGKAVDGTTGSLNTANKAAVGFGIGLKAIGIGLLIAAIAGVVSYFSKFEEGAEKLEQFTSGLGAVIDFLAGRLGAFGKQIVDVFTSPIQQIEKLGNFMKKAFNDPKGALDDLKNGVNNFRIDIVELASSAVKAGNEMATLTKRIQELEDAENAVRASQARQRGEVELLMLAARDRGKAEQDRVNGLKRAGEIEKALTDQQLKFAREALDIALKQDEIDKRNGKLAEERSKTSMDAEVRLIEMENASAIQRQQIRNRESGLIDEINKERLDRDKAYQEKITAQRKLEIELRLAEAKKGSQAELDAQIENLKFERDQKQKEYKKGTTGYVLAQKIYEAESLSLTEKFTKAQLELQLKGLKEYLDARKEEFNSLNQLSGEYYTQQGTDLINSLANNEISIEGFNDKRKEIELNSLEQQRQNAIDTGQSLVDIDNKIAQTRLGIRQDAANKEKSIEEAKYQYISELFGAANSLLSLIGGQSAEAAEFAKALAIFQIGIDTARSISQIITLATLPTADNVLSGGLTVPIKIASLTGSVLANFVQVKKLLSDDAPKPGFYEGGFTTQGNPKEEAVNLGPKPYTYHKSEYVVPARLLSDPDVKEKVDIIEMYRTRRAHMTPRTSVKQYIGASFEQGGYTSTQAAVMARQTMAPAPVYPVIRGNYDERLIARHLAEEIKKIAPPVIEVKEIITAQKKAFVKELRSNI